MEEHELLVECRKRMDKTIAALEADLAKVQTGRVNPALLEDIKVDYYGTPTPPSTSPTSPPRTRISWWSGPSTAPRSGPWRRPSPRRTWA